jgi:uncharacterized membrane protein
MKKNHAAKLAMLAALALLTTAFSVNAAALKWVANANAGGSGSLSVDSCACEAQRLAAEITNDGSTAQKYSLEADFGSAAAENKVSFFLPQSIEVPRNSKKTITLIAAPACDAPLKSYPFTLTARGSNGETVEVDGEINAVECRSLKVNAPADVPTCSGETAAMDVRVINDGETRAEGSIITDLAPGVFTLSDSSFALDAGKEKTITLRVTVPALTPPGEIPFKINAVARGVYAEALSQVTILDCSGLRVLMPGVISVEPATSQKRSVSLRNDAAGADSFALSLADCPAWIALETKTLSLEASASGTASLVINPPNDAAGKEFKCTLRAKSAKRGNEFEGTSVIRVSLPSAATLYLPVGGEYCETDDAPLNFSFSIRNKGENQGTFEIAATGAPGALNANLASIAPGETKRFVFSLDARRAGDYVLIVTVKSAFGTETKTTPLRVVKCNAFETELQPNSASFCSNETKNFTLTIRNTGRNEDSYAVTAQAPGFTANVGEYAVSVAPNAAKQLALALTAPTGAAPGMRSLSVSVKSNAAQATRAFTVPIDLRNDEACGIAQASGVSGATGEFAGLYTGVAGFLVALIAGLFVVFVLAGRKPKVEENESNEDSDAEENELEATQKSESSGSKKSKSGKVKKKR